LHVPLPASPLLLWVLMFPWFYLHDSIAIQKMRDTKGGDDEVTPRVVNYGTVAAGEEGEDDQRKRSASSTTSSSWYSIFDR